MENSLYGAFASPGGVLAMLLILAFAITLGILWFLLPFAVFGTKPKLDGLKEELQQVNQNLQLLIGELRQERMSKEDYGEDVPRNIRATRD